MNQTDSLSSTPIIRLFQKTDADAVSALVLGIQNDEFNLGLSICDQADLTDIDSYYLRSNGTFLVAENDRSDIVGTIGLLRLRADLGVMKKFFVAAPTVEKHMASPRRSTTHSLISLDLREFIRSC